MIIYVYITRDNLRCLQINVGKFTGTLFKCEIHLSLWFVFIWS